MKGKNVAIFISTLILILAIFFYGKQFLFHMDWELISTATSPDGAFTIKHYQSRSEAGHAPYGDNLVIESWKSFPMPKSRETFFAGYCGQKLRYFWAGNERIIIHCPASKGPIRTQAVVVHGIKVEVITN